MHPDTLRSSPPPDLPAPLRSVVAAARRRASRAGDGEVDTGHLLHSLLESDPEALAAAAPRPQEAARLMGYLVQRSIGFGRHWRGTAEQRSPASPRPAEGALGRPGGSVGRSPQWSAAASSALERAARRSGGCCQGLPLLAELAADPDTRSVQILRSAGIDPALVRARCGRAVCN